METKSEVLNSEVGGTHYSRMKIQPIEYIMANNLPFADGNVVKYISRHRFKNGAEDVEKVIHYCKLILSLEYKYSDEQIKSL